MSIKNYAKAGFGLGLGLMLAQILYLLLGLALFIPGLMLVKKGRDSNTKQIQSDTEYYGGMVMMGLGVVLMGGAGLYALLENIDF